MSFPFLKTRRGSANCPLIGAVAIVWICLSRLVFPGNFFPVWLPDSGLSTWWVCTEPDSLCWSGCRMGATTARGMEPLNEDGASLGMLVPPLAGVPAVPGLLRETSDNLSASFDVADSVRGVRDLKPVRTAPAREGGRNPQSLNVGSLAGANSTTAYSAANQDSTALLEGARLTSSRGRGLLLELARLRPTTEQSDDWPVAAWKKVVESGLLSWGIPAENGGYPATTREMLEAYIDVSRACLTTAFILTQRNSAVQRLVESSQQELKERLLPPITAGQLHVTLGISHLTTSRQHVVRPAVEARSQGSGLVLEGEIPWVTAAPQADLIVAGGAFRDGRQVLVLVPTDARGVHVHTPADMMALNASQTSVVTLDGVEVPGRYILAGPVENVLKKTGGGAGNLSTSALAIGQTRYALAEMGREAERRPELADFVSVLTEECDRIERSLLVSATPPAFPIDAAWLRTQANSIVTRTTQAWMALAKGAGYMNQHPAAIAVRQSLFFFVWSCPQPVLTAALRELTTPRVD